MTSFTLDRVTLVYDTDNHNYGTVPPDQATEYIFFESMPDAAAATADSADQKIIAGRLIPPNSTPHNLAAGKYTLQIFPDSSLLSGYNANYFKN